jgi:hypothetical protein
MILRFAIVVCAIAVVIALVVYSHNQRQKRYIRILGPISEHPEVIGDGAWIALPAKYPDRFTNYREKEPRGM